MASPLPLEVRPEHISALDSTSLVLLLKRLIDNEAASFGIARYGAHVPLQITVGDGGEDGRIEWQHPDLFNTDYFPSQYCAFQSKAQKLTETACKKEIVKIGKEKGKPDRKELKSEVRKALEKGGTYIMFCGHGYVGKAITDRETAIKNEIEDVAPGEFINKDIHFYDANKIAAWANQYTAVQAWIKGLTSNLELDLVQTWESWSKDPTLKADSYEFVLGEKDTFPTESNLNDLKNWVSEPRAVVRLVGMSGLGKTRLALEVFRPKNGDVLQNTLSDSVFYCKGQDDKASVIKLFSQLRNEKRFGICVVDECDIDLHDRLWEIVKHEDSRLSVITVDYDTRQTDRCDHWVPIKPFSEIIIQSIISQAYPTLGDSEKKRIVDFAKGFPSLAVLLGEAHLNKLEQPIIRLQNDLLVQKMVWGRRASNDEAEKILRNCSLFKNFGIQNSRESELEWIANNMCDGMDYALAYKNLSEFRRQEHQVLQVRGDVAQVVPTPLALQLASIAWPGFPPRTVKEWFGNDSFKKMPDRLLGQLCEQLTLLDHLDHSRDLVERLCGSNGPFRQPEVLNTERGSRCFRSFVEVNPEASLSALEMAIGDWSTEELKKFEAGRRNTVWALEKLCFRKSIFERSIRLLRALSVAEIEHWANNASGQFIHLFSVYLSGTEATGDAKLKILEETLFSDDEATSNLGLEALNRALETGSFTRTMGAEEQGSGPPLEDWQPSRKEALHYWRSALRLGVRAAISETPIANVARQTIATRIRSLVGYGLFPEIETAIKEITEVKGLYWPSALENLADLLAYDEDSLNPSIYKKAKKLFAFLQPRNLEDRLRFFVTDLPWGFFGHRHKLQEKKAAEIAEEFGDDLDRVTPFLKSLLSGEQRQTWSFGRRLGEIIEDKRGFIERSLSALREVEVQDRNPSLLGAFLRGAQKSNPKLVYSTIRKIPNDHELSPLFISIVFHVRLSEPYIRLVTNALREGKTTPNQTRLLANGSVLSHLPPKVVEPLVKQLSQMGDEGRWSAIDILGMYVHGKPHRRLALAKTIVELVSTPGMLLAKPTGQLDVHHYKDLVVGLLRSSYETSGLARLLTEEIISAALNRDSRRWARQEHDNILSELLKQHKEIVWLTIKSYIANADAVDGFLLQTLLGTGLSGGRGTKSIIEQLSNEELMDWCNSSPKIAPSFLARSLPVITNNRDGGSNLTETIQFLIDEFGEDEEVTSALSANIGTYSWAGSLTGYYAQYIEPLTALLNHPTRNIRKFAKNELAYIDRRIEEESRRDEEQELGVFD